MKLKKSNKKTILNKKKIAIKIMMIKSERLKKLNNNEIEKKKSIFKINHNKKNRNKKKRNQIKRKKL